MADQSNIAALGLIRQLGYFIQQVDGNHKLDSAAEAQQYADRIDALLIGETDDHAWLKKFGTENLAAWKQQLQALASAPNFARWKQWQPEANQLRSYLLKRHHYQEPTMIVPSAPIKHCDRVLFPQGCDRASVNFYAQPSHLAVESALLKTCQSFGSAKQAIAQLEALIEAFPDDFHTHAYSEGKPPHKYFDGRAPERLAQALNFVNHINNKKDFIPFATRVDGIMDWEFSLRNTATYLRLYEKWQRYGKAFWIDLQQRRTLNVLFSGSPVAEHISENTKNRILRLTPEKFQQFVAMIEQDGIEHFFTILGDEHDANRWKHKKINTQFVDFFTLWETHGEALFQRTHDALGVDSEPRLIFIAAYKLVLGLESTGEDVATIMRTLRPHLVHDDNKRFMMALLNEWDFTRNQEPLRNTFKKDEARELFLHAVTLLHRQGKLHTAVSHLARISRAQTAATLDWMRIRGANRSDGAGTPTLPDIDIATHPIPIRILALYGADVSDKKNVQHSVQLQWEQRTFWLTEYCRLATLRAHDLMSHLPNDISPLITAVHTAFEKRFMHIQPHTAEDSARLDRWTSMHVPMPIHKSVYSSGSSRPLDASVEPFERAFLRSIILTCNDRIPDDKALQDIASEAFNDELLETGAVSIYMSMYFFAEALDDTWQKAARAMRVVSHGILHSASKTLFYQQMRMNRNHLSNHAIQEELYALEAAFEASPLNNAQRDMLARFLQRRGSRGLSLWRQAKVMNYIRQLRIFVESATPETLTFIQALEPYLTNTSPISMAALHTLHAYFKETGEAGLQALVHTWERAQISLDGFTGDKRLLSLSEADIRRLRAARKLFQQDLASIATTIVEFSDDQIAQWTQTLRAAPHTLRQLPPTVFMELWDIPNSAQLFQLFEKVRLWQQLRMYDTFPHKLLSVCRLWKKNAFTYLAQHVDAAQEILTALGQQFNGYRFQEFYRPHPMDRSILKIPSTLADLVRFETSVKTEFLSRHQPAWEAYRTVIRDEKPPKEHAIYDADRLYRFTITDYAFLRGIRTDDLQNTILAGQNRKMLIDNLLIHFTDLPILQRQKNKRYDGDESVSRGLLESLPLTDLMRLQWQLSIIQRQDYRQRIFTSFNDDLQDTAAEQVGIQLPTRAPDTQLRSLSEPLRLIPMVDEPDRRRREMYLKELDLHLANESNPEKRAELRKAQADDRFKLDGSAHVGREMRQTRFGWYLPYHNHSLDFRGTDKQGADYAGPSGSLSSGDIAMTFLLGGSVVFTNLEDGRGNLDYYNVIRPRAYSNIRDYQPVVIDLGIFSSQPEAQPQ